jgi:hypothetical protein
MQEHLTTTFTSCIISFMTMIERRTGAVPEPAPAAPSEQSQAVRHEPKAPELSEEDFGRDYLSILATAAKYAITPIPAGLIRDVVSILIAERAGMQIKEATIVKV